MVRRNVVWVDVSVLTGAGDRGFCSGADLKERDGMSDETWLAQHAIVEQLIRAMMECPVPVIAAVNGVAFGGGFELALAAKARESVPAAMGMVGPPGRRTPSVAGSSLRRSTGTAATVPRYVKSRAITGASTMKKSSASIRADRRLSPIGPGLEPVRFIFPPRMVSSTSMARMAAPKSLVSTFKLRPFCWIGNDAL